MAWIGEQKAKFEIWEKSLNIDLLFFHVTLVGIVHTWTDLSPCWKNIKFWLVHK